MTIEEMKKVADEFKSKEENGNQSNNWVPIFLALFSIVNSPNYNLEKEVAFLGGKIDTLEKLILAKEAKPHANDE